MSWTRKKEAHALGRRMAYVERGAGDPIVFLHGNPTSSYLWRNIIPHAEPLGRVIAPDLVGMGDSEKLKGTGDDRYRFVEHRKYLDAFMEELGIERNCVLVLHDWGSALGFDWARRHAGAVRGVAFMEPIVLPKPWSDFPEDFRQVFQAFRSEQGEAMVLEQNMFVEQVLPAAIMRKLSEDEMAEYRRPFQTPGESRRPTLVWPREIPIAGEPADMVAIVERNAAWLDSTPIPKLYFDVVPGAVMTPQHRAFVRGLDTLTEVSVEGIHFVQEDAPEEIGRALAAWIAGLPS